MLNFLVNKDTMMQLIGTIHNGTINKNYTHCKSVNKTFNRQRMVMHTLRTFHIVVLSLMQNSNMEKPCSVYIGESATMMANFSYDLSIDGVFAYPDFSINGSITCSRLHFCCHFDVIHSMTELLTSSVHYEKVLSKFGQQRLAMVKYACGSTNQKQGNI